MAGELLGIELNVRTGDDFTALTDTDRRETSVAVGQIFHLEVSYRDLRPGGLIGDSPSGAYSLGVDLLTSLPDSVIPVLGETQLVTIGSEIRQSASGTIELSLPDGTAAEIAIADYADNPEMAFSAAMVELGFEPEDFSVRSRLLFDRSGYFEIHFGSIPLAGVDVPDLSVAFDLRDAAGDVLDVAATVESVPPRLADGAINAEALRFNLETQSRSFAEDRSFYDGANDGDFDPAIGFENVVAVGRTLTLPRELQNQLPGPIDAFSVPVYTDRPFRSLDVSLDVADSFQANTVFGLDRALEREDILLDPVQSVVTIDSVGKIDDGPLNNFYFTAETSRGTRGLFISDGTTTRLVRDRVDGPDLDPTNLTWVGDRLFFTGKTIGGQTELYVTDGNAVNTDVLADISDDSPSEPQNLTAVADVLYFTALRPDGQRELYAVDAGSDRARLVKDLSFDVSSEPQDLTAVGRTLYFSAINFSGQRELYRTDGTPAGTEPVANTNGDRSGNPSNMVRLGSRVFFLADSGDAKRLFSTNGTAAGTTAFFADTDPKSAGSTREAVVFNGHLYFDLTIGDAATVLYRTDGTSLQRVTTAAGEIVEPSELTVAANQMFFAAEDAGGQRELFVTDGSNRVARLTRDISGPVSADPEDLTAINKRLAFTAITPTGERELFRSSGTADTTGLVLRLTREGLGTPSELTAVGNRLAFLARHQSGSSDLYFSTLARSKTDLIAEAVDETFSQLRELTEGGIVAEQIYANGTGTRGPAPLATDTNRDGQVDPSDALLVINQVRRSAAESASAKREFEAALGAELPLDGDGEFDHADVDQNGVTDALDALRVINHIRRSPG